MTPRGDSFYPRDTNFCTVDHAVCAACGKFCGACPENRSTTMVSAAEKGVGCDARGGAVGVHPLRD
jgi:hypothetical protein